MKNYTKPIQAIFRYIKNHYIIFSIAIVGLMIYSFYIIPLQKNYYAHHVSIKGVYLLKPIQIEKIEMIDHQGRAFTNNHLKGHWSLLFFGFAHCQIICPMTLSSLNTFYQEIEKKLPKKDLPQVIFITIDPERDTIDKLGSYIGQFNKKFIAARASIEQTISIANEFHITFNKIQTDGKDNASYQLNHSPEVVLINPSAEIQAYFSFPLKPSQLAKDYLAIIKMPKNETLAS